MICFLDDFSYGMVCIEICCVVCDSYFGYVFEDGFKMIGLRFCVNLVLLIFNKKWILLDDLEC